VVAAHRLVGVRHRGHDRVDFITIALLMFNRTPLIASLVSLLARGTMMADGTRDPRVDAYIATLPDWQQAICWEVRELIHAADPAVAETIKRTVRPYFVLDGNIAALLAARDHVSVFLYDPLVTDPQGIISSGHDNQTSRQITIRRDVPINGPAFTAMVREIIGHNRAGGWRKLKR
jgi:hypothetical protein